MFVVTVLANGSIIGDIAKRFQMNLEEPVLFIEIHRSYFPT